MQPAEIVSLIVTVLSGLVSVGLLLLLGCAVAAEFGLRVPWVPKTSGAALAWLCGAWWLWRGGKL